MDSTSTTRYYKNDFVDTKRYPPQNFHLLLVIVAVVKVFLGHIVQDVPKQIVQ